VDLGALKPSLTVLPLTEMTVTVMSSPIWTLAPGFLLRHSIAILHAG
jgi:hypothetical protein